MQTCTWRPVGFLGFGAWAVTVVCACASEPSVPSAAIAPLDAEVAEAEAPEASIADAGIDSGPNLGLCASKFGSALTPAFGRLDGELVAIVRPVDKHCAMPNGDHLVLQVKMSGDVYRMVVNVESDRAGSDPKVRFAVVPASLPPPAWSEGWHVGTTVDYAATFGAHTKDFAPLAMNDLVDRVIENLRVGQRVAVYATSGAGRPESAHKIHRNKGTDDGAIVIAPDSASPRALLFHFDQQNF